MFLKNLFDSHVHLIPTGQLVCELELGALRSIADFATLRPRPECFRGPWLVGFGWDENRWLEKRPPTRHELDAAFPDVPVYFSRCDGHSGVTNTEGLRRLGLWLAVEDPRGGQIFRDENGFPTGRLTETAHYRALEALPRPSSADLSRFITEGVRRFHAAGFTHIRDMGASERFWDLSQDLEKQEALDLHVEWNFVAEHAADFDRALDEGRRCRARESRLNKVAGLKFYFDGSLGSDTAFLSRPYAHREDGQRGLTCWEEADAARAIEKAWKEGFAVAIHTIGDAAVDSVVEIARKVSSSGIGGRLNLEHVEVIRPETIQKMKGLHVTCHLQPCHWLNDRQWLRRKLGPLAEFAFPWEGLRRAKIPLFFGSDSPIEPPSLFDNLRALKESAVDGIPEFRGDVFSFHVHPSSQGPVGMTRIEDGQVVEVRIDEKRVFSAG